MLNEVRKSILNYMFEFGIVTFDVRFQHALSRLFNWILDYCCHIINIDLCDATALQSTFTMTPLKATLLMTVVLSPTLVSDDYAPQRAGHASLPGPTAPLVTQLLQLPVPGYGTVYRHILEMLT